MARHSKDADKDAAFKQYREAAPDHVDDETLKKVIIECNNNPQAIGIEIQHFWEDSRNNSSTDEWKTTNKTKKTEIDKTQPTQPKSKEDGGRGSGGRGSGRGKEGGRGSGGRGVSAGRGPSSASSEATPSAPNSSTNITNAVKKVVDKEKPRPPRPSSESTSVPVVSTAPKTAWATTTASVDNNWASVLKKSLEKEKKDLEVPVEETKDDIAGRSRNRKGRSKDKSGTSEEATVQDLNNNVTKISIHDENIGQSNVVKLTEIVPSLTQSPTRSSQSNPQQENEPPVSNKEQALFNMGKWEIPISEDDAFQFGSFGNHLQDSTAVSHSPSWGVVDSVTNQNGDSSSSWSNNQNNDISAASGTGSMGSVLRLAENNTSNRYTPKTNELEPQQQKTQNRNAPGQNRNNKQQYEQNQQYGQQVQAPPGIPAPAGRGPIASMPYSYNNSVYDQSLYYSPNIASIANPTSVGVPGTTTTTTNVNTATTTAPTPTGTTQAPQQPQQQQYPPAGYGFYSPYFPNQHNYYYGGGGYPNVNVYSQGRNVYNPPRGPYGADPYGSAGSLYGDVYNAGQFPDSTGTYGNIPMHPSMPLPVASGNNAGGKSKGSATAVPGSQQVTDHNAHQNYNPYPYGRDQQQWQQYQQSPAAGWGTPMMMPAAPAQQMPPGFSNQQTNMQSQASGNKYNASTGGASIHGNTSTLVRGNSGSEQRW